MYSEEKDFYYFYFLDEDIFKEAYNKINNNNKEKENIKYISTVGNIADYDQDNRTGYIKYESEYLYSNFQRVANKVQVNQEGIYFFYGFLQNNQNKTIFICENFDATPTLNFNRQKFEKYLFNKRKIIEQCKINAS